MRSRQSQSPKNPSLSLDLVVHSEQLSSWSGNDILEGTKKMRKGRLLCDGPGTGNGQGYWACPIGSQYKKVCLRKKYKGHLGLLSLKKRKRG